MLLSNGSVKLRSLGVAPLVLALAVGVAGAASTGCFFVEHDHHVDDIDDDDDVVPEPEIVDVSILADQVLQAEPGKGVGIFVEYTSEGQWHIWTTCDTFTSKQVCAFDIYARTALPDDLREYAGDNLEPEGDDGVMDLGNGEVNLVAYTDSDTDGMLLNVQQGASLELEVYLDQQSAEPFVYWVSRSKTGTDVVRTGAPSNPVRFQPVVAATK